MERTRIERTFEDALERIEARLEALKVRAEDGQGGRLASKPPLGVLEQQARDARLRLDRMRARQQGWDALKAQLEADLQSLEEALLHGAERLDRPLWSRPSTP